MVALCYWRMQLQIARRLIMVVSRWSWVASGGAVLLGNATADCSMGGVMAELLCLSTQAMWLEVRWRAKCCVLQ